MSEEKEYPEITPDQVGDVLSVAIKEDALPDAESEIAKAVGEVSNVQAADEGSNRLEVFDGEILHPSLDINGTVLVLGFRYRATAQEEKDFVVVVNERDFLLVQEDTFKVNDKIYSLDKRKRKLMRIEERWSMTELQNFRSLFRTFKEEMLKPAQLFGELVEVVQRHVELADDVDYTMLVAWVLGTYFFPIFSAYPFLHVKAPKHSGKSQCLTLLMRLCFNAVKDRPSLAALGDTVDALRGTYLIDQADSLKRVGSENLLDILADSYKKSGGKRRIVNLSKQNGREVQEFETYSPKVFASIVELPEDLRDRCLVVGLIRSQRNFPDPDDGITDWREVRGKIYQQLIAGYGMIAKMYTARKIDHRTRGDVLGRSLELWLPFEVMLDCFGQQAAIPAAWQRFNSQYGFTEYEPDELEEAIVRATLAALKGRDEAVLTPMAISELVDVALFAIDDKPNDKPKQKAARVGRAIKKFNLASEKLLRANGGVRYLFKRDRVEDVCQSYFKILTEPAQPAPEPFDGVGTAEIPV